MIGQPLEEIRTRKAEIIRQHGPWTAHTIHLGHDLYTDDDERRLGGNSRLIRRIAQLTADLAGRPLTELRVLDLASMEGQYGIELAQHGAEVVGVEIRDTHIAKARFAAEALRLERYEVRRDDIRNLTRETYGSFDVVLCIGILYHLDAPDVFDVIQRMSTVCTRLLIIDTHVSDWRGGALRYGGHSYRGRRVSEHLPGTTVEQKIRNSWASIDNTSSVWLSRPSLANALQDAGFTSVYDCDVPAMPGRQTHRRTLVAVKGTPVTLKCTPGANGQILPRCDERSLARAMAAPATRLYGALRSALKLIRLRRR